MELEQAQVIGILGLQGTYQELKRGKLAQVFEPRIFQKKRPAGKSRADTSFKPGKRRRCLPKQGKNACELIVAVVRVSKGFRTRTSGGQAVQSLAFFPRQRIKDALETGDHRFFGQK